MNDELKKHVLQFLSKQTHVVIAVTLKDARPWAVPVTIINWQGSKIEWESKTDKLHSIAIETHPNVAIVMFDIASKDGFYAEAEAKKLHDLENGFARYQVTIKRAWHNGVEHVKRELDLKLLDDIHGQKEHKHEV